MGCTTKKLGCRGHSEKILCAEICAPTFELLPAPLFIGNLAHPDTFNVTAHSDFFVSSCSQFPCRLQCALVINTLLLLTYLLTYLIENGFQIKLFVYVSVSGMVDFNMCLNFEEFCDTFCTHTIDLRSYRY